MTETLTVDGLPLAVLRSRRRRTPEVVISRAGEPCIAVPESFDAQGMAAFARASCFRILKRMAEKEPRRQPLGANAFVSGDDFLYLGRCHRLHFVDRQDVPLTLDRDGFRLRWAEAPLGRVHFTLWYHKRGEAWVSKRLRPWAERMRVEVSALDVAHLPRHWGACGRKGQLVFHWALMMLPPGVIDYVIVHELAHLRVKRHTPRFWSVVERTMPDFEGRMQRLACAEAAAQTCLQGSLFTSPW